MRRGLIGEVSGKKVGEWGEVGEVMGNNKSGSGGSEWRESKGSEKKLGEIMRWYVGDVRGEKVG